MNLVIEENIVELKISSDSLEILTIAEQGARGAGATDFLNGELFTETPNGTNKVFTIPYHIYEGSEKIYFGRGRLLKDLGYTITYGANSATVTFDEAPSLSDAIFYDAIKVDE